MYVASAGWVVAPRRQPPWQTVRSGQATMSTGSDVHPSRSVPSVRLSASPDARIIDVSSSRTSTVPDVLLNAPGWLGTTRQPPGWCCESGPPGLATNGPPAAVAEERGKTSFRYVRQRALISASGFGCHSDA